jgi:hypothetical protein
MGVRATSVPFLEGHDLGCGAGNKPTSWADCQSKPKLRRLQAMAAFIGQLTYEELVVDGSRKLGSVVIMPK